MVQAWQGISWDVRLQLKPYLPGRHSSHAVPLKPPWQRHSPVPVYPSSQEPWPWHGVSGPPGQAERLEKKSASLAQVHVCSLSQLAILSSVKLWAGNACNCISLGVCKSGCDTFDYCEPCALNSLTYFHSSYWKGVEDPFSPDFVGAVIWLFAHSDPCVNGTARIEPFLCVPLGYVLSGWPQRAAHSELTKVAWDLQVSICETGTEQAGRAMCGWIYDKQRSWPSVCPGGDPRAVPLQGWQVKESSLEVSAMGDWSRASQIDSSCSELQLTAAYSADECTRLWLSHYALWLSGESGVAVWTWAYV